MVQSLFCEIHLFKPQCRFYVFYLLFQRLWYAFQLLIVSELFHLFSWNFVNAELTLFWISLRIAIVDLTVQDTVAKFFLSLWSIKHKIFVTNNISLEMLFEILSKKLINLIDNLPIWNSGFLTLFYLGQELFAHITL